MDGGERLRLQFGLERDAGKRFALWCLMYMLDVAPDLDFALKGEADREAARDFMDEADRGMEQADDPACELQCSFAINSPSSLAGSRTDFSLQVSAFAVALRAMPSWKVHSASGPRPGARAGDLLRFRLRKGGAASYVVERAR